MKLILLSFITIVNSTKIKGNALILFDPIMYPKSEYSYYILDVYQLENVLGHFKFIYYHKPTSEYQKGEIFNYDAVFYFGSVAGAYIPKEFLEDLLEYDLPIVWIGNNFNNFQHELGLKPEKYFGFKVDSISYGYDVRGRRGFYRYLNYKGLTFSKWYSWNYLAVLEWDPEVAVTTILDSNLAKVVLKIRWWGYGEPLRSEIPYIIRSRNFWYIAGDPFSYIGPSTPYTIFCDILHDILGQNHHYPPRALVRLEDINPSDDPENIIKTVDFLSSQNIPFSMAVVPIYRNPYDGKTIYLHDVPKLVRALKYALKHGGKIFMHGTTHQQDITTWQKYNITTIAYEYFDFDTKTPVPGDNLMWVYQRIKEGINEFKLVGLPIVGFEVPHYSASRLDFYVFGHLFNLNYHRPALYLEAPDGIVYENQFFPFVVYWDIYGETLIPENLGYVGNDPGYFNPPDSIIAHAKYFLAVRDGIASFFWHPTLTAYADEKHFFGLESLKKIIRNLQQMGYTFVSPTDLIELKDYFGARMTSPYTKSR